MTRDEARQLQQTNSFWMVSAQPAKSEVIGWMVECVCTDGAIRQAFDQRDIDQLARSGLLQYRP